MTIVPTFHMANIVYIVYLMGHDGSILDFGAVCQEVLSNLGETELGWTLQSCGLNIVRAALEGRGRDPVSLWETRS